MSDERKEALKAQFGTLLMTSADVDAAYRLFLGRMPVAGEPHHELVGLAPADVFKYFLTLPEFRQDPMAVRAIAAAAKAALEMRQAKTPV